jgi:hypothetical protein
MRPIRPIRPIGAPRASCFLRSERPERRPERSLMSRKPAPWGGNEEAGGL